jgi:hypothetical protein
VNDQASIPLHFLTNSSESLLRDFALNALNQSANLRKAMEEINEEMETWRARALLADWLIKNRGALIEALRIHALQQSLNFSGDALSEPIAEAGAAHRLGWKVA